MPNNYPRGGIFSPHLTTVKDSYSLRVSTGTTFNGFSETKEVCNENRVITGVVAIAYL